MKVHTISLIGKRDTNEDKHTLIFNLDNNDKKIKPINFFAVYDGHGGREISSFLEKSYHKYFTDKSININPVSYKSFKKYVEKVHNYIQKKLESRLKNISYEIGSTSLALYFYKHNHKTYYYVINAGDCRSVLCTNNKAIGLSTDHKPGTNKERKRINEVKIPKNISRSHVYYDSGVARIKGLSVSRAFGDMDAKPYVSHIPDVFRYTLGKTDKFIIIACDGLWDVLNNKQAVDFVLKELKELGKVENNHTHNKNNIAKKLAQHAIDSGSYDNVSIIILFLD